MEAWLYSTQRTETTPSRIILKTKDKIVMYNDYNGNDCAEKINRLVDLFGINIIHYEPVFFKNFLDKLKCKLKEINESL